jgi:CheY-like chemotaxis protein
MLNILLVDDNPGDQVLFKEAMEETRIEHQLNFASSANECLSKISAQKPDLIFMDLIMPGLPGGDFVRILHKDPSTRAIPVIFLTGVVNQNTEMGNKLNVGGEYFPALGKPVDSRKLNNMISKIKIN